MRGGRRRRRAATVKDEEDEEEGEKEEMEAEGEGSVGAGSYGAVPYQQLYPQPSGMSGLGGQTGSLFLPLLQPLPLGQGMQQQFGITLSLQPSGLQPYPSSAFQPDDGEAPQPAAAAAGGPRLPAIRTRAAAAAAAAAHHNHQQGGSGGADVSGLPADLAELLSPLAASLLSPLGLNGSPSGELPPAAPVGELRAHQISAAAPALCCSQLPTQQRPLAHPLPLLNFCLAGWKDSPLGKLSTGELARLLSDSLASQLGPDGTAALGSGGLLSPNGLLSPARHRLARQGGGLGSNPLGSPASGGNSARGLSSGGLSLARLFSSNSSEADLMSALQVLRVGGIVAAL